MRKTRSALQILEGVTGDDAELRRMIDEATLNAYVAQLIYDARSRAQLTQAQLAKLVGTTQSVIARLEDSDYDGHSLNILQRIAAALNKQVEIRFVPVKQRQIPA